MIAWVVGGVVVAAVLMFGLAVLPLLGRLREFGHTVRALQRRVADARALEAGIGELRTRAEALQEQLKITEERAMVIQARRGDAAG